MLQPTVEATVEPYQNTAHALCQLTGLAQETQRRVKGTLQSPVCRTSSVQEGPKRPGHFESSHRGGEDWAPTWNLMMDEEACTGPTLALDTGTQRAEWPLARPARSWRTWKRGGKLGGAARRAFFSPTANLAKIDPKSLETPWKRGHKCPPMPTIPIITITPPPIKRNPCKNAGRQIGRSWLQHTSKMAQ